MGLRRVAFCGALLLWTACRDPRVDPPGEDGGPGGPDGTPTPTESRIERKPSLNPIPAENLKPGDANWRGGRNADAAEVELYAAPESLQAGDSLSVHVSTSVPAQVLAEVYRVGHYGGAGARKVWTRGPFSSAPQPACPRDSATALVECSWSETFAVPIDPGWVSGLYLVKVSRGDGFRRFTPFIVRDRRAAEVLYQPGFLTYQAYNTWGGESLYYDGSGTMPNGRAYQVSFNRPYAADQGLGKLMSLEIPFLQLLEEHGYDVTYGSNLDFARFSDFLAGIGAFVLAGQDEYWLEAERDQVDAALSSGTMSLAYFGANGGYWRVRALPDSEGTPLRTIACYKNEPQKDPIPNSTVRFRDPPNERPENGLFGVMYDGWQLIPFPLAVRSPSHWLFHGTGLRYGELLHGLVGFEFDRIHDNRFSPAGMSVLFESPVVTAEAMASRSHAVERTLPSGRFVFSAGTIWWPLAMSKDPELEDARIQRITLNVLERALDHRRPVRNLGAISGNVPSPPAPRGLWAASVNAHAGTAGNPGHHDGPGSSARFDGPTGLAVTPFGDLVVADTGNNRIRIVLHDPARTVETLAGTGGLGMNDGPGATATFRRPTGVAVALDGTVYVADSDNHCIRAIAPDTAHTVTVLAGGQRQAGFADGPRLSARFRRPMGVALDDAGSLYVADLGNNRVRRISLSTGEVMTIAGSGAIGSANSPLGTNATFNSPTAVAFTPAGLFVMDAGNQQVRRVEASPPFAVTTIAGRSSGAFGFADGTGASARFRAQLGLAAGPAGDLYLSDTANFRIRKITPDADASRTQVFTIAGSGKLGSTLGTGEVSDIGAPTGIAVAADGRIFVSDSYNHAIRKISP